MDRPGLSSAADSRAEVLEGVKLSGSLGRLSLPRQVITLATWPLLEQILAFVVGTTDVLIAGRMAEGAERIVLLDAMGLGGFVAWFIYIFQGAVATGVMALVSRATGARDMRLANRGLGQGLWLGAAAGTAALVILQLGAAPLTLWMGLSEMAAIQAEKYIQVLAWSAPPAGAMFAVNAALRGSGDTRTPFLAMLVVNFVNVLTSVLFVFAAAPFGGRGIEGIALGTVVGWLAGLATVSLILKARKRSALRWTYSGLRWHWNTIHRIGRIGVPQAIEIGGMWAIHSFSLRVISALENDGALGAHFIAIRLESMSFLPGFAIAAAAAALTGQYLGAKSPQKAIQAVRFSWKLAVGLMITMGITFVLGRNWLVELMAPGSDVHRQLAAPLLVVCAFTQPFFATCIVLKTTMRGAGATRMVMRWAFSSMIFYRIGVIWLLSQSEWLSLTSIWVVLGLDQLTQALIFTRLHLRGDWLRAKV